MQIATMTSLLYSYRNSKSKTPVLEAMRRLKDAGFLHFDLHLCGLTRNEGDFANDDWRNQAYQLRNEAEKLGACFVQSHAPYYPSVRLKLQGNEELAHFERMLLRSAEITRIVGAPFTVVHPVCDPVADMQDQNAHIKATIQLHRHFLERAEALSIRPAFENMFSTDETHRFGENAEQLLNLCDTVTDCSAGVCWDFGHANLALQDQCDEIRKLGEKILCVHTHDNRGKRDDHLMPFIGNIEWERILPTLRETGFSNDLVLEVNQNANMPDDLRDDSVRLCAKASHLLIQLFEREAAA